MTVSLVKDDLDFPTTEQLTELRDDTRRQIALNVPALIEYALVHGEFEAKQLAVTVAKLVELERELSCAIRSQVGS